MKNLKRTVTKYGQPLGHRKGLNGTELLNYEAARNFIYLPTYRWVLQNKTGHLLALLRDTEKELVLLDYETNTDVKNLRRPLSHAGLIRLFLENRYPQL